MFNNSLAQIEDGLWVGYERLCFKLFAIALSDVQESNGQSDRSLHFLKSDWAHFLASMIGIENSLESWLEKYEMGEAA